MKWVNGIPKWQHNKFHKALKKKFGGAIKCDNEKCTYKNPKRFDWALKKGHSYSSDSKDYVQLCVSCHRKYDFNESVREKLSAKKLGECHNRAKLTEIDVFAIYTLIELGEQNMIIANAYGVHPSTISDIKSGKRWGHLK